LTENVPLRVCGGEEEKETHGGCSEACGGQDVYHGKEFVETGVGCRDDPGHGREALPTKERMQDGCGTILEYRLAR